MEFKVSNWGRTALSLLLFKAAGPRKGDAAGGQAPGARQSLLGRLEFSQLFVLFSIDGNGISKVTL